MMHIRICAIICVLSVLSYTALLHQFGLSSVFNESALSYEGCSLDLDEIIDSATCCINTGDISTCKLKEYPCLYAHDIAHYSSFTMPNLTTKWNSNAKRYAIANTTVREMQQQAKNYYYYITFTQNCCKSALARALTRAKEFGFDEVISYNGSVFTNDFRAQHANILQHPRGAGFWLWKPYTILKTLVQNMQWGDYLCYVDAGSELIRDPGPLIDFARHQPYGVWTPHTPGGSLELNFNKRDTLIAMDMDYDYVHQTVQAQSNHLCMPKSLYTIRLVTEWLSLGMIPNLIADSPSIAPEHPEFIDHRHDQAIWSLLIKRWRIPIWRDATQWGEEEMAKLGYSREGSGAYLQTFYHHRDKSR